MSAAFVLARVVGTARQRGHSIVEVLVAMLLALLAIAGTLAAYEKARAVYSASEVEARLQENARYALTAIETDLRMAGYWGQHNQSELISINAESIFPAACGATWVTDFAHYVDGSNNDYVLPCAASGGGARAGSDVLIVRRASADRIAPQSATIAAAHRTQVLIVTNRTAGEVFVPRDTGNLLPAGYATSDTPGEPPLADTRQLRVSAYYVSRNSSVATGYPALRRKTLVAGPAIGEEEVLPGIEDLQLQLGVDTGGDPGADLYVNPGAVPAGGRAVAVRIWLRLRAEDPDPAHADRLAYVYADQAFHPGGDPYRRLLIAKTIQLRDAPP